jgi:hypothetical protein
MKLLQYLAGFFGILSLHASLHAQFRIHSYGVDIANSINAISVGYQNFESIGMKTNFITKGQPEFSILNPQFGISLIAEYHPLFLMGRISIDDKSGFIQDEIVPSSLTMQPHLSYVSFESAILLQPWDIFSIYGGPSLNFLLDHSIGKLGIDINTNQLTHMNSPIPGFFAGLSADIPVQQSGFDIPMHLSPYVETAFIFNQRTGEFPQNQDGFDNIWSTFSIRTGISISLHPPKSNVPMQLPFTLHIPDEMAGKRSMIEHVPLKMSWDLSSFQSHITDAQNNPRVLQSSQQFLCSKADPLFHNNDLRKQRACIEQRSVLSMLNHLKQSNDTCIVRFCSTLNPKTFMQGFTGIAQGQLRIDSSRFRFNICSINHKHQETVMAEFSSKINPIIQFELESVSPTENVIICTLHTSMIPKEWFINIEGPQKYTKTFGPFTSSSVHLDGSELLQGEAGAGAYTWNVLYQDEHGNRQIFSKDFRIRISNENKMHGHSFTYVPEILSDTIIYNSIRKDLKQYLKTHDEILLIIDASISEDMRKKSEDILRYIDAIVREQKVVLRNRVTLIEKGIENALYEHSTTGILYERGIRMEIIH